MDDVLALREKLEQHARQTRPIVLLVPEIDTILVEWARLQSELSEARAEAAERKLVPSKEADRTLAS